MLIDLQKLHTYNDILRIALRITNTYPTLINTMSIGKSYDNRDIFVIKVGKGTDGPVVVSGVHARERLNSSVMMAVIECYATQYYASLRHLLEKNCIYFIPILNPDGYTIAIEGFDAINNKELLALAKKTNISQEEYKQNVRGIDINRNFPCQSFRKSLYSGTCMSEIETKKFIRFCNEYHTLGLLDIHSRGKSIYYYRGAKDDIYNQFQYKIASLLAKQTNYSINQKKEENPDEKSGGNTVQYYSEFIDKPALTIETVDESATFPLSAKYQEEIFKELIEVPYTFLKVLVSPLND